MSLPSPLLKPFPDGISPEDLETILHSHAEVILLLWTDWCSSCQHQRPVFDNLARQFPNICFVSANLGKSRWIQERIQVAGVPTFLFFRDGAQIFRATGDFSAYLLASKIQEKFLA
jgi:thioredoxin 1